MESLSRRDFIAGVLVGVGVVRVTSAKGLGHAAGRRACRLREGRSVLVDLGDDRAGDCLGAVLSAEFDRAQRTESLVYGVFENTCTVR